MPSADAETATFMDSPKYVLLDVVGMTKVSVGLVVVVTSTSDWFEM